MNTPTTHSTGSMAGKNISIYLTRDLLALVESSGRPPSQLVQDALRHYFMDANRKQASRHVVELAKSLGSQERFAEAVEEWRNGREKDRFARMKTKGFYPKKRR